MSPLFFSRLFKGSILRRLGVQITILCFLNAAPFGLDAWARTIIYPGTFDPFNSAHQAEVEYFLKNHPKDHVIILPIDMAPYTRRAGGEPLPKLFDMKSRTEIIRRSFVNDPRVTVSLNLVTLHNGVFDELDGLFKASELAGQDTGILIGDDIFKIWSQLDYFPKFLAGHSIIVSRDPRTPASDWDAMKTSIRSKNLEFIEAVKKPVRSYEVNTKIITGNRNDLDMTEGGKKYLFSDPNRLELIVSLYRNRLAKYYLNSFNFDILPKVSAAINSHFTLHELSPEVMKTLVSQSKDIQSGRARVAQVIVAGNPQLYREHPHLYQDLLSSFEQDPVRAMVDGFLKDGALLKQNDTDVASQKTSTTAFSRFLGINGNLSKLFSPLKTWIIGLHRLPSDRGLTKGTEGSGKVVTVYRGIRPQENKNMDRLLAEWKRDGMLSKTALYSWFKGDSVEESEKKSASQLASWGYKKSVINHVMGEWRNNTPLVSATLDKEMAMNYAGNGGYLLTIKVPESHVIYMNDPAFWIGTPWEKTGNPYSLTNEVGIENRIHPNEIEGIEKLSMEMNAVGGTRTGTPFIWEITRMAAWSNLENAQSKINSAAASLSKAVPCILKVLSGSH